MLPSDKNSNSTSSQNKQDEEAPLAMINEEYALIKRLGKGSTSDVFCGYSVKDSNRKIYAFKVIYPEKVQNMEKILIEKSLNSRIHHENVIQIYHHGEGIFRKHKRKTQKKIYYFIEEYLENGDLYEYIGAAHGFGENYSKLIFFNLLNGLEAIHNAGIVHRDIKPQNIMLSSNFTLKYIDFGFATNVDQGRLTTYLGTPSFAAPELFLRQPYIGVYNDIFALGVTLYLLVAGSHPFYTSVCNDIDYNYIEKGEYDKFWENKNFKPSSEFKELFNCLVAFDCTQRPSIKEIKCSKWVRSVDFNLINSLLEEFKKRREYIDKVKSYVFTMQLNQNAKTAK